MQLTPTTIKPSRTDILDTIAQAIEEKLGQDCNKATAEYNKSTLEVEKQRQKIKAYASTVDIKAIEKEIAAAVAPILKKHGFVYPINGNTAQNDDAVQKDITCSISTWANEGDKVCESISIHNSLRKKSKPRSTTKLETQLTHLKAVERELYNAQQSKIRKSNNFRNLGKTERRAVVMQMTIASQTELLDAVSKLADSMVADADKIGEIIEKASW